MVTDPVLWKDRQQLINKLTAIILAAVYAVGKFGYEIPFSEADALAIAGGVAVIGNWLLTFATSDKVGLLPPKAETPVPSETDLSGTP